MRKSIVATVALAALVSAAVATAAAVVPPKGTHFKGTTSAPKIGKFKDPVSFGIGANDIITSFKFGTLGCLGAGGFPPNKNPYTLKSTYANAGAMAILPSTGSFSATKHFVLSNIKTTAVITGRFTKSKGKLASSGKIQISQNFNGQNCTAKTLSFKATG